MNELEKKIIAEMAESYGAENVLSALATACIRSSEECKGYNDIESAKQYEQEAVIIEGARKKIVELF